MTKIVDFLLEIEKARRTKKQIFINNKPIKTRTIADHAFLEAIFVFVYARLNNLDADKMIKMVLVSNLYQSCENEQEWRHMISLLPKNTKEEIKKLNQQTLNGKTKLSRVAQEIVKIEKIIHLKKKNLLLYSQILDKEIRNPQILKIKKALVEKIDAHKQTSQEDLYDKIAQFLLGVSFLQSFKRRGWVMTGVRDVETVAQHTFHLTIASWILGEKKGLDPNKTMKLGLIHDLCEIYAGDQTPYDPLKKISKDILKKPARIPKNKKIEWLIKKKQKEWESLKRTTELLPREIANEIKNLWVEFEERLTKEGRFVYQLDKVENVFQATHYWLKDKEFPIVPWWVRIKEVVDDKLLLDLIAQLDEKFKYHLLKLNGPQK